MGGAHSLHLHGDGRVQNDEAFSAEDHQRLLDAISEAHMSCASKPEILMLWEMPGLAAVFSDESVSGPIVPSVPTVLGYVEPICQDSGHVETAIAIRTKSTAFEHAISFESRKTHHLEEKDQLKLLAQKWEALISIDYHAFDRGLDLEQLPFAERVQVVLEVLGGKSLATIRQRCHN